ncbi:hypothetical protein F5146DRAFT_1048764 [Armillaria mellea]|nr:hypothetical protein F5146DRAFT_1048764 [Armillaria mellea]
MAPSKLEHDRLLMIRGLEDLVKSMKHCVETSEAYLTTYRGAFSSNGQEEDVKPVKGKRKHSDVEEPAVDGKRKRIVKAKDPNAPRRPASTYLLFQNEMRAATKQEHPNIPNQELMSLMTKMWSEMSAAEKQTYVDQHNALIKKYEEEMVAYKALAKGDDEDEEDSAPAKSKAIHTPKEKASDKVKEKAKKDEKAEKAKEKQKEKERETEKEKEKEKEREQEKAKAKPRKSNAPISPPTVESDTSEEEEEEVASSSSSSDSSEDESSPEPVTKKAKTLAPASTATTKKRKA